jgi:hypothetical protein
VFYLCDVSGTHDLDVHDDVQFWKDNCHELERSPHSSCESGKDKSCGPIDQKYPSRWVVPCGEPGAADQVLGGPNGKMAYKIPDKEIKHGVIQAYWLTQNTCSSPDGFMEQYEYPSAWAGCSGDGGSVGGRPSQPSCLKSGQTPEEFFNCADVRVTRDGSGTSDSKGNAEPRSTTPPDSPDKRSEPRHQPAAAVPDRKHAAAPAAQHTKHTMKLQIYPTTEIEQILAFQRLRLNRSRGTSLCSNHESNFPP